MTQPAGIGDPQAVFRVYIANRPPLPEFMSRTGVQPLLPGELAAVVMQTGNHWRKVFNLYAKLAFELDSKGCDCWQVYRDRYLLQADCGQVLLFSEPAFGRQAFVSSKPVHIVSGRSHAANLGLEGLQWLNRDFAIDRQRRLIVCPYFDYRQLSNLKLDRLLELVNSL